VHSCVLEKTELENGWPALRLENGLVRVVLTPEKGADIVAVEHLGRNMGLLYRAPWHAQRPGTFGAPSTLRLWMDSYPGGWQLMLPNAGAEAAYGGTVYGFHGEAALARWSSTVEESARERIVVRCEARLPHCPLSLARWVEMEAGRAGFGVRERVTNTGGEATSFEWGQHIAFGAPLLSADCILRVPARRVRTTRADNSSILPGDRRWERLAGYRVPAEGSNTADFGVLSDLDAGRYEIENTRLKLSVAVTWDLSVLPFVWLWQEAGRSLGYPFYGACYALGVEPCSADTEAGLAESLAHGTAVTLEPGQSRELAVRFDVFER
jgi:galactose mutarotase-like enzyme